VKPSTVILLGLGIVGAYFYMQRRALAPRAAGPAQSVLPVQQQQSSTGLEVTARLNKIWD
jgi:hypothetical protein